MTFVLAYCSIIVFLSLSLFTQVLTYDWSVQMMREAYPGIKFPGHHMHLQTGILKDGTRVFNFEHFLDANNNR